MYGTRNAGYSTSLGRYPTGFRERSYQLRPALRPGTAALHVHVVSGHRARRPHPSGKGTAGDHVLFHGEGDKAMRHFGF
jgi:hypothetical protein